MADKAPHRILVERTSCVLFHSIYPPVKAIDKMQIDEMVDRTSSNSPISEDHSEVSQEDRSPNKSGTEKTQRSVEEHRKLYKYLLAKHNTKLREFTELANLEKSIRNLIQYHTLRNNSLVDIIEFLGKTGETNVPSELTPEAEHAKLAAIISRRPQLSETLTNITKIDSEPENVLLRDTLKDSLYISELANPVFNLKSVEDAGSMDLEENIYRRIPQDLVVEEDSFLTETVSDTKDESDNAKDKPAEPAKVGVKYADFAESFPFSSTRYLKQLSPQLFHSEDPDQKAPELVPVLQTRKSASSQEVPNPRKTKIEATEFGSAKKRKIAQN
ncbi:unnamed protein product [Kuraishia capsulata CBS 1993]|uniref:Uncharacterized protein n=1 Tax=Kuraishia capsulata CBS 1993 TaxID=1382522 RepID=W6MI34_9ASCO|nr:uncharacterized protein KUCA_T00001478001 [Kuraishia capsulata CBS 1993]CDK25508.1 unnamed protein product [Kuraishia capsulata CBS 1993]